MNRRLPIQEGLPKTVKIGAYRMRIAFTSHRTLPDMKFLNGLCDFDNGVIHINRDHARNHSPDRVLTTILHEIGHAINHVYGVRDESGEEGFVTGFSIGFVAFMIDNPSFHHWMNRIIESTRIDHARAAA
jgi:hypothetical protein